MGGGGGGGGRGAKGNVGMGARGVVSGRGWGRGLTSDKGIDDAAALGRAWHRFVPTEGRLRETRLLPWLPRVTCRYGASHGGHFFTRGMSPSDAPPRPSNCRRQTKGRMARPGNPTG